ncbi:hypothetical protein [Bacillus xiapuensis]|uniref:hypothetical protein n=1 Tax=Bacillus xiapuensis TaxID=2014075 RepID=UPI001E59E8EF|nr:hypothetical protein [Bacillus xiapuensis]
MEGNQKFKRGSTAFACPIHPGLLDAAQLSLFFRSSTWMRKCPEVHLLFSIGDVHGKK